MATSVRAAEGPRPTRARPSTTLLLLLCMSSVSLLASPHASAVLEVGRTKWEDAASAVPSPAAANATSSASGALPPTAVPTSIGAEMVEEVGCWNTEFRLTCRELDSTIAIVDARFRPLDAPPPPPALRPPSQTTTTRPPPPLDAAAATTACPAPKEWLEAEPWARAVSPDGAAVVDPLRENESFPWPLLPNASERHFRLALNHRCSGVNHCSFILSSDFEEAGRLWGPGAVRIRYACMRQDRHLVRYCNEEIVAGAASQPLSRGGPKRREKEERRRGAGWEGPGREEGEGFVASPGYPKYYVAGAGGVKGQGKGCEWVIRPRQHGQRVQLTLLDVSLRGVGPYEEECSDWLEITAVSPGRPPGVPEEEEEALEERVLLTGCGEAPEAVKIESPEEAPGLRVALRSVSGSLFPKRGLLFHYKALGCGWPPPDPPKDGYLVSRNLSSAHYMCCVGFKFPDNGRRDRRLRCDEQRGLWRVHEPSEQPSGLWPQLLPDCVDGDTSLLKGNITNKIFANLNENSTSSDKVTMKKEADLMYDILIPTIIIGILLFGNGVILFFIFQFKKRKLATETQEEELRIAQNGTEMTTERPSDV